MTDDSHPRKRLTFDPTINAGHILTFAAMMVAVFMSWNLMDKRVTVLEQSQAYQLERDKGQDKVLGEKLDGVKESIRDLKDAVQQLDRKVRP